MPRYFFNFENSESYRDQDGVELAGDHDACIEAVKFAGEYLHSSAQSVWDGRKLCVEARDARGRALVVISISLDVAGTPLSPRNG
ncbi:DUF6894 family protein [Sandaracinobacteroides hominis]|uniref:DUF6894 family protein n=1 Tax=Sandaracinobacteroides hominis TaxID=2780086 RepID=UPI0018F39BA6|nr:hypothetical protein [Sandaracinobacteroides hominis]